MYAVASQLNPESMYDIARFAYAELAMAGVCAVGEFHYVHHQADGSPYDNRTALSEALIAAAQDVGIRITLIRTLYQRAGFQTEAVPEQARFFDANVDDALEDIDTLRGRYAQTKGVEIGLAIHSIRAVTRTNISIASAYAKKHALPMHMHLSEQLRELTECKAEYGATPVELMAADGILDSNFVAVHATHLSADEISALGNAGALVCICRTTERDLGDGHCQADLLLQAGTRLCTGVDSYASSDPFEEARAIELDQRSHRQARTTVGDGSCLLQAASEFGYAAIGMSGQQNSDQVVLNASDPALVGLDDARLDDAVIFAGSTRAVQTVRVAGTTIVKEGLHRDYPAIRRKFEETLAKVNSIIS